MKKIFMGILAFALVLCTTFAFVGCGPSCSGELEIKYISSFCSEISYSGRYYVRFNCEFENNTNETVTIYQGDFRAVIKEKNEIVDESGVMLTLGGREVRPGQKRVVSAEINSEIDLREVMERSIEIYYANDLVFAFVPVK